MSEVLVSLSAIVVAFVAVYGLFTWRRELTGRAKFEIARKTMFLAMRLAMEFRRARTPFTSSEEWWGRPKSDDEHPNEVGYRDEWYAGDRRLQPIWEDLQKLEEAGWEAEIILGESAFKSAQDSIKAFREGVAELSSAVSAYFRLLSDSARRGASLQDHSEFLEKLRVTIYSAEEDELSRRLN